MASPLVIWLDFGPVGSKIFYPRPPLEMSFVSKRAILWPMALWMAQLETILNINRLLDNLNISPWSLSGRVKEQNDSYKLRYNVSGLAKEDVKIIVHDGVLEIKGEHKDEDEEGSYGYCSTTLNLPDDAKVDDIKAELKDVVLSITIPKTDKPKREVKEVNID
ncbi:26.5 kDa heat shock protein [Pyrus ussuriensis x Pyrus communis]|uniref:26.5 kDa heat shock protein n=1 Tax=Pyrus ussuriensis x Pyrus communis TaxID=2448454 RepID=A0A5N5GHF4_9ROSA|nr:26.5 kDa heat shock protein [Pyrus ussuriensis x Pyrus communis]